MKIHQQQQKSERGLLALLAIVTLLIGIYYGREVWPREQLQGYEQWSRPCGMELF